MAMWPVAINPVRDGYLRQSVSLSIGTVGGGSSHSKLAD